MNPHTDFDLFQVPEDHEYLREAVRAVADRAPIPVELHVELEARLDGPVEAAAYYVVSEALTNVAKYAQASFVRVSIHRTEVNGVQIEVVDDGVGVPGEVHESGLRNARRRAQDLGGSLEISPGAQRGTRLIWRVSVA